MWSVPLPSIFVDTFKSAYEILKVDIILSIQGDVKIISWREKLLTGKTVLIFIKLPLWLSRKKVEIYRYFCMSMQRNCK